MNRYNPSMNNTIQDALSELLKALNFDAMSSDVKTEKDSQKLCWYARIILKNTLDPTIKRNIYLKFRDLNLIT